ncbi:hypothetical protein CLAFUW4_09861 [Fulvia fulva]|uniref:Uncharacterized protein n=1 Tax=Passalora fulva TaxID=5499 RepID=A0A9Q8UUH2_PASFU|nr:uncharacterized protein CLAFUR5_12378 [Fulvia fulva]KAK4616246.1 hypothetical protein CLAFUR4_09867 [Fulvia fulva]KAK4617401.1 hypothetical protein CLAFUR0_09860 [Fulvia fulva]UJO22944.1 hypothetical protein CLAFUR5_12378 [Fulvia fulva]WPV19230.1 hypothetical protein CLAFUW4_09861 [Fulvia fulva]WPV34295.1 hypothetical protein CLAFUW7_09864 [Fulvia fulva]
MGYNCQSGTCIAVTKAEAASSSTSLLPTTASTLTTSTVTSTSASQASSTAGTTITPVALKDAEDDNSFSGKSFAAGFVPGLLLGALVVGLLVFCCMRRKKKAASYVDEKRYSSGRYTLTDLSPAAVSRRPTVHGRSISEPMADVAMGHRTDFLKSSPPRDGPNGGLQGYTMHVHSPAKNPTTPAAQVQKSPLTKGWSFSHSPFVNQATTPVPTQPPLPAHLKRGSITTFQIEPVRGLKKQRSQKNLRANIPNATSRSPPTHQGTQSRPDTSRTGSTETMTVIMDTPGIQTHTTSPSTLPTAVHCPQDAHKSHHGIIVPASGKTWETSDSDDSTPIEEQPNEYTPTRPGRNSNTANIGKTLQSPCTPSNYPPPPPVPESQMNSLMPPGMGVQGNRDSQWRNTAMTTFSSIMEKAGWGRNSVQAVKEKRGAEGEYGMGPDPREWNR